MSLKEEMDSEAKLSQATGTVYKELGSASPEVKKIF